jgi:pimeloyl-ACP methyl ester carboxylesterase
MSKLRHNKILLFLLTIIILVFFSKKAFALQEEFDNYPLDNQIWEVYQNEGIINVNSGIINISADNTRSYPFIFSKNNPIPTSENFSVKFRIKYNRATTKGAGIVLATEIPPNGSNDTPLSDPMFSKRYFLQIWQDSIQGLVFAYSGDCYNQSCPLNQIIVYKKGGIDLVYHDVEFRYSSNKYSIFFDNNQIFISNEILIKPSFIWFGSPTIQGPGDTWTSFSLDYLSITPYPLLSPTPTSIPTPTPTLTPTPTPTPIPTPTPLAPLVLLPGFGGSWNHENMILGIEKSQSDWYMTPGIKVYDGLIETLKNAGYKTEGEDKNFFIFNYNWTKPVVSVAEDLKNYIQNVVKPSSEEKIDLVGHSLGGLVARTYVQNNQDNPVDQLLTIGSPLKGIPSIYYLWEGGNLNKSFSGWQRIGAGLLLHLRKSGFSTTMEAVRSVVPSLKDLLPTFNYLKQNSQEKPLSQMSQKNDWLIALNNSLPNHFISIANNLVGILPNSTIRWFNVSNPPWVDHLLGLWTDGKPENEEYTNGDQTVLAESATLNGAKIFNLENINHMALITSISGQQKIMEVLGLTPSLISTISTNINYEPALVFQIASPATLEIFDNEGNSVGLGDGKLMIVPNAQSGEYQVQLKGTATGQYNLYIGQIANGHDFWTTTSGSINKGEDIGYRLNFNSSSPLENPIIDQDGLISLETALNQISDLKKEIEQQNFHPIVKKLILFRLRNSENLLHQGKMEKAIISLYQLRTQISLWGKIWKLDKNYVRYFKNKIQEIIENSEEVYIISETNKGGVYKLHALKQEIKLAQKFFNEMENKVQKLGKKGLVNTDYGTLYLLAQEKLNEAKSSTSYRAYINALGTKFLSQEILFFK